MIKLKGLIKEGFDTAAEWKKNKNAALVISKGSSQGNNPMRYVHTFENINAAKKFESLVKKMVNNAEFKKLNLTDWFSNEYPTDPLAITILDFHNKYAKGPSISAKLKKASAIKPHHQAWRHLQDRFDNNGSTLKDKKN